MASTAATAPPPVTLLVGISGPSSSGKTTLSRHLRDIFPGTFILHEDDFYKPDKDIPVHNGVADWDCLGALDLPALRNALAYIRSHGVPPPELVSKEDQNSVGESGVDDRVVADLHRRAESKFAGARSHVRVAIVDGFLLFAEEMKDIRNLFDVKLFLRTDYITAKTRREARKGYVTIEGFWEDPPGYVDEIVWPNYVKDHAFLFESGDVQGSPKKDVLRRLGIQAMPYDAGGSMTRCVQWGYEILEKEIDVRQ
ncbi:P-loop containing nucleoside triphosphate hydrolase protein [Myriangium duriaei CBS 260.36]|uniref:P-loop containing nucleoside triphosphate hydrolase protein n=1 Tax=Myriangium duriaei CBS 260.36 TaxID=1168546 RepID=A0A9P4J8U0_9PEZI|nr:P-loop containing nucleoside triphosphate hydrolase protein [Myriangium duriaei CBS 260.36]